MPVKRTALRAGAAAALAGLLALAAPARQADAQDTAGFGLPASAVALSERETPLGVYLLPLGPETAGEVPARRVEGRILRRSWRLQGEATVLQVLAPLRDRLKDQGYEVVLDCAAAECGGFGFRFATEVVPAPDMMVDIFDYHFLSAQKDGAAVSLLASRSGGSVYLQVIEAAPEEVADEGPVLETPAADAVAETSERLQNGAAGAGLDQRLTAAGRAVLRDLRFATGTVRLSEGAYDSLAALARLLERHPEYKILLVGHTDTVGGLEANRQISRQRAASVKARLVEAYGADAGRISIAGAGYMAPLTSNLTAAGRRANRRVEAVLIGG